MRVLRGWVLAVVAVGVSVFGPGARAQDIMTLDQFRAKVVAAIHAADPAAKVEILAPDQVRIVGGKADQMTAYLSNSYELYRQDPAKVEVVVDRFVRLLEVSAAGVKPSADKLVALVRPESYLHALDGQGGAKGPAQQPLWRPLAGDLVVLIAYDEPEAFNFPPSDKVTKDLAIGDDALWRLALEHSRAHLGAVAVSQVQPGIYSVQGADDAFGAPLLLDDKVWAQADVAAIGAHPVVLVGKSNLFVVDGSDAEALQWLKGFAGSRSLTDPTWLSNHLYARNGGAWSLLPEKPAS